MGDLRVDHIVVAKKAWREGPTAAQDDEHAHESHERDPEPVRWLVEPASGLVRV